MVWPTTIIPSWIITLFLFISCNKPLSLLYVSWFACNDCPLLLLLEYIYSCLYVYMVMAYSKSMDQPGKVANPARGQLNRENEHFPVPVRARKIGLARRIRPSRPASAYSLSILRLNRVLIRRPCGLFKSR